MLDDDRVVQTMCQCRQGFELHENQRYDYDDCTNSTIIEEFGSITCKNYNSYYQYGCPPGNKSDDSCDYCINDNEYTYDYEIVLTFRTSIIISHIDNWIDREIDDHMNTKLFLLFVQYHYKLNR